MSPIQDYRTTGLHNYLLVVLVIELTSTSYHHQHRTLQLHSYTIYIAAQILYRLLKFWFIFLTATAILNSMSFTSITLTSISFSLCDFRHQITPCVLRLATISNSSQSSAPTALNIPSSCVYCWGLYRLLIVRRYAHSTELIMSGVSIDFLNI